MKVQVSVSGVDAVISKLRAEFLSKRQAAEAAEINKLVSALVRATPIDTGAARQGWSLQKSSNGFEITNNVPYIEQLNRGHSKQAPSYFIERVLLLHGKASGAIVTKTPD